MLTTPKRLELAQKNTYDDFCMLQYSPSKYNNATIILRDRDLFSEGQQFENVNIFETVRGSGAKIHGMTFVDIDICDGMIT